METNEILKKQAGELLQNYETLNGIASVTGSCALDLMVCPDLDLHVPADQVKNLFGLAEILYQNRLTDELYYKKAPRSESLKGNTSRSAPIFFPSMRSGK